MNIYDCFSPTILIIYRYFQFSSSRSPTECRASPGVLKRMHNNVASRLLASLGLGRISPWRASIGMQSRAARQELPAARCLRRPRWLPELRAGLADGTGRSSLWGCDALLLPTPSRSRGAGPRARRGDPVPSRACCRWGGALWQGLIQREQGLLFSLMLPSVMVQTGGIRPFALRGFIWIRFVSGCHSLQQLVSPTPPFPSILNAWQYFFSPAKHPSLYIPIYHTNISAPFYCTTPSNQQKA